MWRTEWLALSRRILGLLEAAKFHVSCRNTNDPYGVAQNKLIPGTQAIFREVKTFRDRHANTLPAEALSALYFFVSHFNSAPDQAAHADLSLHYRVTTLVALEAEISYHLTDFTARAKRLSERAFAHLQRSIVADPDCAARWQRAFSDGETACERLGAAHLLLHGIWAFKANSEGERTDLILGDLLVDRLSGIEDVAEALVLTEWKKVKKASELQTARDSAHKQAKHYAGSSLVGVELDAYRYLVLVTDRGLKMPDNVVDAGVLYCHINIAVNPLIPSRAARQR
jgi:hypothetical protein